MKADSIRDHDQHYPMGIGILLMLIASQVYAAQVQKSVTGLPYIAGMHKSSIQADQMGLLHISVINMSGKHREAIVRRTVIDLPVAQRVDLQIHTGEHFRVVSNTDSKINVIFSVTARDQSRVIVVN